MQEKSVSERWSPKRGTGALRTGAYVYDVIKGPVSSCLPDFKPISSVSVTPLVFTAHKVSGQQHQISLKAFETCEVCLLKVEQWER